MIHKPSAQAIEAAMLELQNYKPFYMSASAMEKVLAAAMPHLFSTDSVRVAASELLAAIDRTVFYDCGTLADPLTDTEKESDDDASIDGGSCPLTGGHVRRLRLALNSSAVQVANKP